MILQRKIRNFFAAALIRVLPFSLFLRMINRLEPENFNFWFLNTSEESIKKIVRRLSTSPKLEQSRGWVFGKPSSSSQIQSGTYLSIKLKLWNEAKVTKRFVVVPIKWFSKSEISLPLGTDSSLNTFVYSEYEPTEMFCASEFINQGDYVVDLGAHDGLYSFLFSDLVGAQGKVIAVEANPSQVTHLINATRNNGITNIDVVSEAVADFAGNGILKVSRQEHSGHSTLGDYVYPESNSDETISVRVNTLDLMLKEKNIKRVDFIKIDIEGFEIRALKGMENTLSACKPVVLCEVLEGALKNAGGSRQELVQLFARNNYLCKAVNRDTGLLCSLENFPESEYIMALPISSTRATPTLT